MSDKKWMQKAVPASHEGLFTAKAKRKGMDAQGYANKVLANPGGYDRRTVHQALFARNAQKVANKHD